MSERLETSSRLGNKFIIRDKFKTDTKWIMVFKIVIVFETENQIKNSFKTGNDFQTKNYSNWERFQRRKLYIFKTVIISKKHSLNQHSLKH